MPGRDAEGSVEHEGLGHRAIRHLLPTLRGEPAPLEPGRITSVVWRESTAAAPRGVS
ncbi:hypothetical protein AB0D13_39680 [Streptomyces sp. NPDC048430]|uniref:hypothetical protein n=1 Tax=unclassified Streptomyces TaxID=2593676 RepID=UPI003439D716